MSIETCSCTNCGYRAFPERLWCPRCGGDDWSIEAIDDGVVQEVTVVRRRPGRDEGGSTRLAAVALDGGLTVIAKLEGGGVGAEVRLETDAAAITAIPKTTDKEK